MQACMVSVSTRVSEELRSQIESIKLKQTNKLVLKGMPIEINENKEILASHIKASLDDVEETKDVSDNISDMHRTGRRYFNKHGYDYQDVTVTLKNNHTKKQIYQNRKKFIKFKIVPYTTMKRKRILEECKEIAEDPIYNKICDYLIVDIEGTIKCKLKNPLKGNLFHNIYTIDGFINGILELVIIENRDMQFYGNHCYSFGGENFDELNR